jgi:uncharacterized protein with HEPN domain
LALTRLVEIGHRITHGYDVVDYDILWDTVQDDFPPLVAALEDVLGELG